MIGQRAEQASLFYDVRLEERIPIDLSPCFSSTDG